MKLKIITIINAKEKLKAKYNMKRKRRSQRRSYSGTRINEMEKEGNEEEQELKWRRIAKN